MAARTSEDPLSAEDISAGIAALSDADWARINKVSVLLTGCKDAARDLRQEALSRAVGRERRRPHNVTIARFLCEAMRSIISSQRGSDAVRARAEMVYVSDPTSFGDVAKTEPGPFVALASEEECGRITDAVLNLFSDNKTASSVAEGIMEGLEGEELSEWASINRKQLATTRRLVRRRTESAFPEGWHNGN
jgi:DNA-directed RNA polymerase specialized sigma24 family protein